MGVGAASRRAGSGAGSLDSPLRPGPQVPGAADSRGGEGLGFFEDKVRQRYCGGAGGVVVSILSESVSPCISGLPRRIWTIFSTLEEQLQMKDSGLLTYAFEILGLEIYFLFLRKLEFSRRLKNLNF